MRTIRLVIEYDGRGYCGWQVQPRGTAVQAVVQAAVRRMTGEANAVVGASRTDAGVHALGQVAHFHTRTRIPPEAFVGGLRGLLPPDIVVREAMEMAPSFHARHEAIRKAYRYLIYRAPTACALLAGRVWHRHGPLKVTAMARAARALVGTHDFRSWCAANDRSQSKVRTISLCNVRQTTHAECPPLLPGLPGRFLVIDVVGNGFLKQMVRTIVGTLVEIGEGKRPSDDVPRILTARDRRTAGPTAPAAGLYLVRVEYH